MKKDGIAVSVSVTNTGKFQGKEVVQVYVRAPQGALGKPVMSLAGFAKTEALKPGESKELVINVPFDVMASYDETGVSGFISSYVLEKGVYRIYVGDSVRDVEEAGSFTIKETRQLEALSQALAPVTPFWRMKPVENSDGSFSFEKEEEISTHQSGGDALVTCLCGIGRITIDDKEYTLQEGDSIVMPAGHPHAVYAVERFKMLLTVVF